MTTQLILGDCLEEMKKIPDGSIDLVLTDPPYGDNFGYGRFNKKILNNESVDINFKALLEFQRLTKTGGVVLMFCNWKGIGKILNFAVENTLFTPRTALVIVKNNIGMGYGFRNQFELCLVFEKGVHKYTNFGFSNVQKMEHVKHDKTTHPHEKGVQLLERLITHCSIPNSTILDPFMGSGTTGVACKRLGRNFIGIELDPTYFEIAKARIEGTNKVDVAA